MMHFNKMSKVTTRLYLSECKCFNICFEIVMLDVLD